MDSTVFLLFCGVLCKKRTEIQSMKEDVEEEPLPEVKYKLGFLGNICIKVIIYLQV
jgi:hypothetical protein